MAFPAHKTKIVCTLGPSSEAPETLRAMIDAGMNVARLNFSHGDFAYHERLIANLRQASAAAGRRVAIMADLPGPKMRIGKLAVEPVELRPGDSFTLTTDSIVGDRQRVAVTFERLPRSVKPGDRLFLNDGYIQLTVTAVEGADVVCRVLCGGELRSNKGLNLPGIDLGIGAFTERDRECLAFALAQGVDAVSQSFVERADDLHAVRQAALDLGHQPFVIAKIERANALDYIDEIIEAADGIMIARGDLGVEVPIEQIALVQKDIMRRANRRAKPVITATQMLESMTDNRRPTRAEATDVANAILDGTDCVMLSGESAMGKYPVEAVAMLAGIAAVTEARRPRVRAQDLFPGGDPKGKLQPGHVIALAVETSFEYAMPAAVFVPTRSGATARNIGRFRLPVWMIAISPDPKTCQELQFTYGAYPVQVAADPKDWSAFIRDWHRREPLPGNVVLLTAGPSEEHPDTNHRMEIVELNRSP
ncbi:pyruvate kinase [Candidatus Methylocalor cossyra]|uniref:Pyruvate kinase n=1 Tax=Candidatus Methylocalor cossyra TaxID=3108543 RepID=A0ABP1C6Q0_9GAMM